jgi:prolyl-tRNA synthetase
MYLSAEGHERPIIMGSYGIGPARVLAAAIEQSHDEAGIVWPKALAPFDIHMVLVGDAESPQGVFAEALFDQLSDAGFAVLLDDRPGTKPGEKFVEAELLGCPIRVTVGKRTLPDGPLEVQVRKGRERHDVPLEGAAAAIAEVWDRLG